MNAAELEPVFGPDEHDGVRRYLADLNERLRAHAAECLANPAWVRGADPECLAYVRRVASRKPLEQA